MRRLATRGSLVLAAAIPLPAQELTPEARDAICRQVLPSAEEMAWRAIDWHETLGDGLLAGQHAEKPVLLWAMNGHPLGNT